MANTITRRDALGHIVRGAAGSALTGSTSITAEPHTANTAWAAQQNQLKALFANTTLTDQHGERLNMDILSNQPCLVLFGYDGCPKCQEITKTVAAIQEKLVSEGRRVPIVVVSVQPEEDRKEIKEYTIRYAEEGVRQFMPVDVQPEPVNETTKIRARRARAEQEFAAYDNKAQQFQNSEQQQRIFHLVCPATAADAMAMQAKLSPQASRKSDRFSGINPNDPTQHSSQITLFNKGQVIQQFGGLDTYHNAPPEHTKEIADQVLGAVKSLTREASRG